MQMHAEMKYCKAIFLKIAPLSLIFIVFCYLGRDSPLSEVVVSTPKPEEIILPAATDTQTYAATAISISSAKNDTKEILPPRLQTKVRGQEHQKNAKLKPPTASNPKQHMSFRILRPVNWQLTGTIDPYDVIPDEKKYVSASVKEIYFSVKTTRANHATRLPVLILTWMQTVLSTQINIVTDTVTAGDKWEGIAKNQGFHFRPTNCPLGHASSKLCCKSDREFKGYYKARESGKSYKWFCHFDDDVYVNVPMLTEALGAYNPSSDDIYIGRGPDAGRKKLYVKRSTEPFFDYLKSEYKFAYGAGYCISDALMRVLEEYFRGSRFYNSCIKLRISDDMLLGIIIEAVLGHSLTHDGRFNSHYNLQPYSPSELKKQITVSYFLNGVQNLILLPNATFTKEKDPTRFFSYHCLLYPQTKWCK